ncbi:MAG: DNA polymerase IV-like protein ImuB [Burkholderiaceae bacterium]|nr:MAG: DNA polymerase IV-like protein ImuB [Burkholderiaceae bacterium]
MLPQPEPGQPPDAVALGWWALQFTPRVTLVDEAVLLEVSGSERLWGGRERLLARICKENRPPALAIHGQGATSFIAIALLRLAAQGQSTPRDVPDGLPLDTLGAARPHLHTLARLGCRSWGQLRALPRGGVARRFGAPLLAALDAAYGSRPESHDWLILPEVFELACELPALVDTAPALLFGAQRLLGRLRAWLQARHRGVLALELAWSFDVRRVNGVAVPAAQPLLIRTAEPTQDMTHLGRLMAEQLARITLPAPVHSLRLRSLETASLVMASVSLLPAERTPGDSLHQLVERLSARLGSQQVVCLQPLADHRPERMQGRVAAQDAIQKLAARVVSTRAAGTNNVQEAALYPTWLLREPLRLALQGERPQHLGPLRLLAGPQRLEAGWWGPGAESSTALRDYFIAQNEQAGLLWIYRERLAAEPAEVRWFLHGIYA